MTGAQRPEGLSDVFVGRLAERLDLHDVVDRVRAGRPWLVIIEGQSGVGKTAPARQALSDAEGMTVMSARSDVAETDLDYGVIEQLVRRVDAETLAAYPLLTEGAGGAAALVVGARRVKRGPRMAFRCRATLT